MASDIVNVRGRFSNAMLDFVERESERIDSRFLAPSCGVGNFPAEMLRRKLLKVQNHYANTLNDQEKCAILAVASISVASIYGVEIFPLSIRRSSCSAFSGFLRPT
ncbi:MAG: hypothetical protein LBT62_08805 [Deltaproteobacteria bacterium]|jgi:hypothetical protein|nr:hypothetical protein [Deltaproteobacteria bacterium]